MGKIHLANQVGMTSEVLTAGGLRCDTLINAIQMTTMHYVACFARAGHICLKILDDRTKENNAHIAFYAEYRKGNPLTVIKVYKILGMYI